MLSDSELLSSPAEIVNNGIHISCREKMAETVTPGFLKRANVIEAKRDGALFYPGNGKEVLTARFVNAVESLCFRFRK